MLILALILSGLVVFQLVQAVPSVVFAGIYPTLCLVLLWVMPDSIPKTTRMNLYCVWAAATSANLTLAAQRPEWFSPIPWPFLVTLVAIGVVAGMRKIGKPERFLFAAVMLSSMLGIAGSESQGPGALFDWLASLGLTQEAAHMVTVGIRKAIHFGFFGTLAWSAFHASNSVSSRAQAIIWSLSWSIGFAALDEWRQTFSIGRTGTFWDVLLDATGAVTCVALATYRLKQPDSEREKIPTS